MDLSLLTGSATGSSSVHGMGGHHHHHHKSISDQVSQMGSAIDNAVKTGAMTSDQATSLKKELADITSTLGSASSSGATSSTSTTGQPGQSNALSALSDSDRKKVLSELQDVRKQLHASFAQSAGASSSASSGNDAVSQLFSQIDTNNDGSISKDEMTQFLAQVGANALGYNQTGSANVSSSSASWSSFSAIG
jgi:EF hand